MSSCLIPSLFATTAGLISNIAMVIYIYKTYGFSRSSYFLFGTLAISNIVFSISFLSRGALENAIMNKSMMAEVTAISLLLTTSFMQIMVNIALTYDRYYATVFPLAYRENPTITRWKKALLAGAFICFVVSCSLGYFSVAYKLGLALSITILITRVTTAVVLAFLYYKIFRTYRSSRVGVSNDDDTSSRRQPAQGDAIRQRNEKHLLKMCLGITASFALLNIPASILALFQDQGANCDSLYGKMFAAFMVLVKLNMVFDSFWYFFMEKRKTSRNPRNRVQNTNAREDN